MKIKKSFSRYVFLLIFILAIALIFAFSGCCISVPLRLISSAASASASEETLQSEDLSAKETFSNQNDESAADTSAEAAETTSSAKETPTETSSGKSEETSNEAKVAYSNDFTLYDLDKNLVSMHDYAGKIVVLNFWATWCPPCVAEIPDFINAWNTYKSKNVQFFGISDDDVNAIADFVKENKMSYPTLIDGSSDRIMQSWGIDAIPHTFILDGSGEIVFDQLGMMSGDQLVNAIESALNQQ